MTHNLSLHEEQYKEVEMYIATKHRTTYAAGDTLTVTLDGQREQKTFTIVRVLAEYEKVKQAYCILLLDETTE